MAQTLHGKNLSQTDREKSKSKRGETNTNTNTQPICITPETEKKVFKAWLNRRIYSIKDAKT